MASGESSDGVGGEFDRCGRVMGVGLNANGARVTQEHDCVVVVDLIAEPFTGPRRTTLDSVAARPAAPCATDCSSKPLARREVMSGWVKDVHCDFQRAD